jgi:hypothetical protein
MERLSLGNWVGVSGAAFSTGMGAQTSIGFSLLAGLFNVRLGYWWDSGVKPSEHPERTHGSLVATLGTLATGLFPAQMLLIDELLARFHGTALRYWYLSDGGHFENIAVYELIRRRVPIILACDCGADPGYLFEDIGNLVRRARIDFNAEIVFPTRAVITQTCGALPDSVGTLDELRQKDPDGPLGQLSTKHAALALVYYDRQEVHGSVLLVVKPTMTGDEPTDLLNYRSQNPTFPQEPTAQQFFDEAQWESYRKLGQLIGENLSLETELNGQAWLWSLAAFETTKTKA